MKKTLFVVAPEGSSELAKEVFATINEELDEELRQLVKNKLAEKRWTGRVIFDDNIPVKTALSGTQYVDPKWHSSSVDGALLRQRVKEITLELLDREWERRVFFENQNFLYKWLYRLELFDLFWPFIFQFGRIAW